ncbi:long-chain fatty acid--CoA ligase [Alpinimonas psychrophila]|uniref:Fatty-acyl-CoA synthase n=1 Tax=Alpinimonas psychrophila TaxID=748908 RepID=A0A7W3JT98_9MICO|nr:fatty-acyl-CoA synthase [Alpinimonas psychrophila]
MIERDGLHTLGRWTRDRAIATPHRVAVDDRGVVLTYIDLDCRSTNLAESLLQAGYGVGDRIATVTGNSADHVVLFFACAKAGFILVPLSWRLTPRELAQQLETADPALLLIEEEFSSLAGEALNRLLSPMAVGSLGAHGIERKIVSPIRTTTEEVIRRPVRDDDALLLIFTSGTLEQAKAAILTHANCFWTNLSLSRTAEITRGDTVLAVMPQYHVGGWNIQPLLAWWMGATVVLERTFDPGRVLKLIADRGITTMMGVPANYLILAEHPAFATTDLSSLSHAIVGGAPMPEPLLRVWHERGVALTQGYGLTEASPNVLCLPDEEARSHIGSAGKPYPHVEVAVTDPITGEILQGVCTGELMVRGPGVFAGYFRAPDATKAVLRNGWLATGDLVSRDEDGNYRIIDRIKDIFITGGESVAPAEIEGILFGHPAVADVSVVGVPDDRWGEVGVAWVVLRSGVATDETDLLTFCSSLLARFKVPKQIIFVAEIPRSASNKAMRRALLAEWKTASENREDAK